MNPHNAMEFEWDAAKSDTCITNRGFGFSYAVRAFLDGNRMIAPDHRRDYDEYRYRLLGTIDGRVFVVIYTMRDSATRIISARKANGRERFGSMSDIRVRIDPDDPRTLPPARVDYAVLDATTEEDIARQAREDDAEAMRDTAPERRPRVPT